MQDGRETGRHHRARLAASGIAAILLLGSGVYFVSRVTAEDGAGQAERSAAITGVRLPSTAEEQPVLTCKRMVALIEGPETTLSPELGPIETGIASLILSDLAGDPEVCVVSRERVSDILSEAQLGESALTEPSTAQRLGRAARADVLLALRLTGGPARFTAALQLLSSETGEPTWNREFSGTDDQVTVIAQQMVVALRERLGWGTRVTQEREEGRPATVAVFDFRPGGPVAELDEHTGDLADLLAAYLSTDGTVRLVERVRLAAILEEQALGISQRGAEDQPGLGRLLGAQRFLNTTMIQWGKQVRFVCHLVEPQSGLIVAAVSAEGAADRAPDVLRELAAQVRGELSAVSDVPVPSASEPSDSLTLEAAVHYARGVRLAAVPTYPEAVAELASAAFLAPDNLKVWLQLVKTCYFGKQYDEAARHALSFMSRQPDKASGEVLLWLARAEEQRRNWPGLEAAARAVLAAPKQESEWRAAHGSDWLITALARQGRWEEAIAYCEGLPRQTDDRTLRSAWTVLLAAMNSDLGRRTGQAERASGPDVLAMVRRAVDAIPAGRPMIDEGVAPPLSWPLLRHCLGYRTPGPKLYEDPPRDLEEGLDIATAAADKFEAGTRIPAMAGLARGLLLARMDRPKEAIEVLRGVLQEYPTADVDESDWRSLTPPMNGMIHFYIGLINEHIGDESEAASAYREAVGILDPNRATARFALSRLNEWHASLPHQLPWEKRVQAYHVLNWGRDTQFVDWLRAHHYQLWGTTWGNENLRIGSIGTLVVQYKGYPPQVPSAEDLRTWVVHGGRLLLLCHRFTHPSREGWGVAASRRALDQSLNWVLHGFGISMDPGVTWTWSEQARVAPTDHPLAAGLQPFDYTGQWWSLSCPEEYAFLRLTEAAPASVAGDVSGPVVAAARELGLGRVAVVTLRQWFPSHGRMEWWKAPWEDPLLERVMTWLTEPPEPEHRELVQRYSAVWTSHMARYPCDGLDDFLSLSRLPGLWGEEAGYAYARGKWYCGLSDKGSPVLRELARSASDEWLRRSSALWLARLLRKVPFVERERGQDAQTLREAREWYRRAARSDRKDVLWATALIEQGSMAVVQGDFAAAEPLFREVVSVFGHSGVRIRALFGLGYAVENQGRLAEAARIYRAIEEEYGEAHLPPNLEYDWPDPWRLYWPVNARPKFEEGEPLRIRVRDAVGARLQAVEQARG